MIGMLRSEFYKLFTKKSFYICAFILMFLVGVNVWTYEWQVNERYAAQYAAFNLPFEGIDLKKVGYTAWNALEIWLNLSGAPWIAIFSSIFVCSEFSSGAIKNLAIRGKNRFAIYFSKLLVCMLVPIIYYLLSGIVCYSIGAYLWSPGSWDSKYLDSLLIPAGLNILVQIVYQSFFVMIAYLCRSSGWASALNFGIASDLLPGFAITGVNYISKNWFGVNNLPLYKYWIGYYTSVDWPLTEEIKKYFLIVILAYLIIPSIIGSLVFQRREIK